MNKPEPFDLDDNVEHFKIVSKPLKVEHNIYLGDSVSDTSTDYTDLLKFLETAEAEDMVYIHMANFGGAVHSGLRIAHAIRNCNASTVMLIDGPCYSMGAILALAADGLIMYPGTFLMFHNYSNTQHGKAGEIQSSVAAFGKHFKHALEYFCKPFLNKKEVEALMKDEDVYIHAEDADLNERLRKQFPKMLIKAAKEKKPRRKIVVEKEVPKEDPPV